MENKLKRIRDKCLDEMGKTNDKNEKIIYLLKK